MRITLCAASIAAALFAMNGEALAAVGAERSGGFEDCLTYGPGAGKAHPASPLAYEALVVCQRPYQPSFEVPPARYVRHRKQPPTLQGVERDSPEECQILQIQRSCRRAAAQRASAPASALGSSGPNWSGTYVSENGITFNIQHSGSSLSATYSGQETGHSYFHNGGTWSGCVLNGSSATCHGSETYSDDDKSGQVEIAFTAQFSCGSASVTSTVLADPAWSLKHGPLGYNPAIHKGAVFQSVLTKKNDNPSAAPWECERER